MFQICSKSLTVISVLNLAWYALYSTDSVSSKSFGKQLLCFSVSCLSDNVAIVTIVQCTASPSLKSEGFEICIKIKRLRKMLTSGGCFPIAG